ETHGASWIDLRSRYHQGLALTGDVRGNGVRPSAAEIEGVLVPWLRALARSDDEDIRTTALMAWARIVEGEAAVPLIETVLEYLHDEKGPWRDVIVFALGIPRHARGVEPLASLVRDLPAGRELIDLRSVPDRMRATAALALGQLGGEAAAAALLEALESETTEDVRACCWLAAGASVRELSDETRARVVRLATKRLDEEKVPAAEAAALPAALALAGDPIVVPVLRSRLARFADPMSARAACVLAILHLAPRLDEQLADVLIATARRDPDQSARRYALVTLGDLALRTSTASDMSEDDLGVIGGKLMSFWRGVFGGRNVQRWDESWASLGAGRFAAAFPEHREETIRALRKRAVDRTEKERESAAVLALAIAGDQDSLPLLRKILDGANDVYLRSWSTLGLGALGGPEDRAALEELAFHHASEVVRYRAIQGLVCIPDPALVPRLIEAMRTSTSDMVESAVARAIGEIGDRRALRPLMEVASDESVGRSARRRAISALALLAEPRSEPWVRTYQRVLDANRSTPALDILLRIY
ncbi:MAG: HEAT repeat domain-containing protein, partial [Planctomycetota bacterium]